MSTENVKQLLRDLRFDGMAASLEQQLASAAFSELAFIDRLDHLLLGERLERQTRTRQRLFRRAKFKHKAADPADIIYGGERGLDKPFIAEMLRCDWIRNTDNLLISGATGTGKTWLACCLGIAAINQGMSALYVRTNLMLEEMRLAHLDHSIAKMRTALIKVDLLILDDFGIAAIAEEAKEDLLELLDGRSDNGSTLVVGQRAPSEWHTYLKSAHMADAIMDRVTQRAHRLRLDGPSLRARK